MLVGYLTLDDVHFDCLAQAALGAGIDLHQLYPRDWTSLGRFDAFVVDLDYLAMPLDKVLQDLLEFSPLGSYSVHGHYVESEHDALLQAYGVRCVPGFDPHALLKCTLALELGQPATREEHDHFWEAWIEETSCAHAEPSKIVSDPRIKESACDPSQGSVRLRLEILPV